MSATAPRSFTIHTCLGRGGFGEVYRAEMHRPGGIDAEVALKVLRRDVGLNGQAVQRLRDEGRLLAKLSHPAILKVHDLLTLEGRVALVTEFVDGEDLGGCFDGADPMPLRALLEVISQVAGALDAAWTAPVGNEGKPLRMVHRDVKPSNIRIGKRGAVKLLDFGIARTDEMTREARTMTDMLVGSPPYMAPERFLADNMEPASDTFALGATLAEGIAGRRVFDVPVTMLAGLAVSEDRYTAFVDERVAPLQEKMPAQVFALLRSMLAYAPDDRPLAADVARACERLADRQSGPTLARWAKARDWSPPADESGELDGREVIEGTLEARRPGAPTAPPTMGTLTEATTTTGGRVGLMMGGMSLLVLLGSVSVLVVTVMVIGLAFWQPWAAPEVAEAAPEPAPVAAPVAAPEPAAKPEPEPVVEPEPEPAPRARPQPDPEPVRVVVPAQPKPRPKPEPAPAPAPPPLTSRVDASGDPARLVKGGEVIMLPAEVPPGVYTIQAQFQGAEWTPAKEGVSIGPGTSYAVRCGNYNCRIDQR